MRRPLLVSLTTAAILVTVGGAVGSEAVKRYHLEDAWPSKVSGADSTKKSGSLKGTAVAQKKESKEKGGTEDINIGVGELQESKGKKGLAAKQKSPRAYNPKEFKLDQKATWKAAPKTKTFCMTPDGKRRAC
jgi:hypothetical protein